MADKKISQLTALTSADSADVLPIVDTSESETKKITTANLLNGIDHTTLTNKGTNTHDQIDTALAGLATTSGTNTGDETLTTIGTKMYTATATSIADEDYLSFFDATASWVLRKITWTNLKGTIRSWILGRTSVTVGFDDSCDYVCDGLADDIQINAAITYLNGVGGGKLKVQKGTYDITEKIIHKDGVHIVGEGFSTILKMTDNFVADAQGYSFIMGTAATATTPGNNYDISLQDICLDGNKANQTRNNAKDNLIHAFADYHYVVKNVEFKNGNGTGLDADSCGAWIEACVSHDNGLDGFYINDRATYGNVDSSILGCKSYLNGRDGIFSPERCVNIQNNRCFFNGRDGIHLLGFNDEHIKASWKRVSGNYIRKNSRYPIYVEGQTATCVASENIITQNIIVDTYPVEGTILGDNQNLSLAMSNAGFDINYWRAQAFTPTYTNIYSIGIALEKFGNPTGDMTWEIQSDNAGVPSGTVLASGTLDVTTLPLVQVEFPLTQIRDINLTVISGTKYHFCLKGQSSWTTTNNVFWAYQTGATFDKYSYGGGNFDNQTTVPQQKMIVSSSQIYSIVESANCLNNIYKNNIVDYPIYAPGTGNIIKDNIGDDTNTDIDTDGTLAANSDLLVASQKATKTYADTKVAANVAITGATKTKITYDAKGLVTAGVDATTADIADSTDKRYCTDAQKTVIGNTSGTNSGDNAPNTSIAATKLDDFTAPDDNTDLNASTTAHGLLLKATAPAAGLTNVVAIENGETVYKNKALFDATDPTTQAFGDAAAVGSAVVAARRDHKHAMPAAEKDTTAATGVLVGNGSVISAASNLADVAYLPLAGGTLSGDVQLGETDIKLDAALSGDEKWSGITMAGIAGAALVVGEACYLASSGKWLPVDGILDGTDTGFNKEIGMCVLAASGDTEPTEILKYGKIRSAKFPAFTVGSAVYLSDTAGELVVAQPSTTNFAIRVVGFAITEEDLLFNPSNDCIVHV